MYAVVLIAGLVVAWGFTVLVLAGSRESRRIARIARANRRNRVQDH